MKNIDMSSSIKAILLLTALVTGCGHRQIQSNKLFVSDSIEDSLEQFINEIGPINEDCNIPTVAAIVVCEKGNSDTTISICIQKGYPPVPPAPADDDNYVPPIEKGMCIIKNRICCVKYIGLKQCPHLINEEVLKYDPIAYARYDPINYKGAEDIDRTTDMSVSVRPSEKIYKYCGQDSIRLIFRRVGPTEELFSKGEDK